MGFRLLNLAWLVLFQFIWAAPVVAGWGQVVLTAGHGHIRQGEKGILLPQDTDTLGIAMGDQIYTYKDGTVQLSFKGVKATLGPNGFLVIKDTAHGTVLSLIRGRLDAEFDGDLRLQTIVAVIELHQGQLTLIADAQQTCLEVHGGEGWVANITSPEDKVAVQTNSKVWVQGLDPPQDQYQIAPQ